MTQQASDLQTMSSVEIAELTGKDHGHVMRDIRGLFSELQLDQSKFGSIYKDAANRNQPCFALDKELTLTLVAGYNAKLRHAIVKRWHELEQKAQCGTQAPAQLSRMEILQLAMQAEQENQELRKQVTHQKETIDELTELFTGGMTIAQFCKQLNGVNVMQVQQWVANHLGWIRRACGGGWQSNSQARDKYVADRVRIANKGQLHERSVIDVTLLNAGAERLFKEYNAGNLPMKATWNGRLGHLGQRTKHFGGEV